jgi:antitoxin HigA-1
MKLNTYIPKSGLPVSPGEILLEEFLIPMGMTQTQLANLTDFGTRAINEICRGKRSVIPRTAILFSDVFSTSVELWLNFQHSVDIGILLKKWDASRRQ